jgi:CDP-diacylglycerol--glycerol-3-phosphate 3-phosphatidyltransferase
MSDAFHKHAAHFVVALRSLMILMVVWLFSMPAVWHRVLAFVMLTLALALDGLDGYLARRYGTSSTVGGLLDTLADRITENVLIVYFAYEHMIPVAIAIFFVTRSLLADFVRTLNFQNGIATFAVHTSLGGRIFVASALSRILYLVVKCLLFICCGIVSVIQASPAGAYHPLLVAAEQAIRYLAYSALVCSAVRFAFLLFDSRKTIQERLALP